MSHSTEHPRNGETYHAYYFGFDGTGTPVDKVLKAVARAGACYHHTEQWADDDGQICHMNQIQIAADEAAAEMIALRSLVGELVEGLERLAMAFKFPGESNNDRFERVALEFYKETRYVAPGKDCRLYSQDERQEAYDKWFEAKVFNARNLITKAQEALK